MRLSHIDYRLPKGGWPEGGNIPKYVIQPNTVVLIKLNIA